MSAYRTKFYGKYKFSDNTTPSLAKYIENFSKTSHIERDENKIKKTFSNWKNFSYNNNLGYNGEFYVNPAATEDGPKHLLHVGKWCHWTTIKENNSYYLVWDGNTHFFNYETWLKYLIEKFFFPNHVELNGVMLQVGMNPSDANYMVLFQNVLYKYDARDIRDVEELYKDFSNKKIIINSLKETFINPEIVRDMWCSI